MNENLSDTYAITPEQYQNVMSQAIGDAFKTLPHPKMPSWVESAGEFIKIHPWISLGIVLLCLLIISAIVREMICSYLKTSEILSRVKRIEQKLKEMEKNNDR